MRTIFLVIALAGLILNGCRQAPSTEVAVIEYPATWTPGPTATATPPPPTATLVVQRTVGPLPTSDPQLRTIPTARGPLGLWIEANSDKAPIIIDHGEQGTILTGDQALVMRRSFPGAFAFLRVELSGENSRALLEGEDLSRWDGVILESAAQDAGAESSFLDDVAKKLYSLSPPRILVVEVNLPADAYTETAKPSEPSLSSRRVDGLCLCQFLRSRDTPVEDFKPEDEWRADVDALAELSADGDQLVLVATRFADDLKISPEDTRQWFDYSVASFLLGVRNNHSFLGLHGGGQSTLLSDPLLSVPLGKPIGAMYKLSGVYQRRYQGGLVVVNPTGENRTLLLSRPHKNVNNEIVHQLELAPHTGVIVLRSD